MKGGGHDLCILTDGDADRVGIIDETGRFINQLQVFALLVLHLFDVLGMRGPIVKTVNMTAMVEQLAKQFNTEVYEVQVGFKIRRAEDDGDQRRHRWGGVGRLRHPRSHPRARRHPRSGCCSPT